MPPACHKSWCSCSNCNTLTSTEAAGVPQLLFCVVTCISECCHLYHWLLSILSVKVVTISVGVVTYICECCRWYQWMVSPISVSVVTNVNECCHKCQWVLPPVSVCSCHLWETVWPAQDTSVSVGPPERQHMTRASVIKSAKLLWQTSDDALLCDKKSARQSVGTH